MQNIVIFTTLLSLALFAMVDGCRVRNCTVDADCKRNECCATKFTGDEKICRDMGDDVGDVCGGSFFCSNCGRNLVCVPLTEQPLDELNCRFPANGTCQSQYSEAANSAEPIVDPATPIVTLEAPIVENEPVADKNEPVPIENPVNP